jgi:hypothetical protein
MAIDYELLKIELSNGKVEKVAEMIYEVYLQHQTNFMKPLLLNDCLPEPLQRDFEEKNNIMQTFGSACNIVREKLEQERKDSNSFSIQQLATMKSIYDLYRHNKSNTKELENTQLFEYPIPVILHMLCVFLENQERLSEIEHHKKIRNSKYIDLFDSYIADIKTPNGTTSLETNLEAGIELVNILGSYLFYKGKKALERNIGTNDDVSPYDIPSIEKLSLLTEHRGTLDYLWSSIKYRGWKYTAKKTESGHEVLYYEPSNQEFFRFEKTAIQRYRYKEQLDFYNNQDAYNDTVAKVFPLQNELSSEIDLKNSSSIFNINEAHLKQLVQLNHKNNKIAIRTLEFIDPNFWERNTIGENKSISFENYFTCVAYLQALGAIYSEKSHESFNDDDRDSYKYLAPRIDRMSLITHFSTIINIDRDIATELLNILAFQPKKHKDEFSDLFSQPLFFYGKKDIILVPTLIKQLNLPRMIEQQFTVWGIDDAYKGKNFERDVNRVLSHPSIPRLKVNTGSLIIDAVDAFDGKEAQFDFFATFDDYILLIEMKCLRRPYTHKEIFQREHDVYYGVEQVNRRAEVLQKNWDKVREKATITLPLDPPDPNKVIKVVCLNIFDFTGKIKDGVIITDASALTKYFTNPIVQQIKIEKKKKIVGEYSLWEKNYPTPTEFIEFLKKPNAIRDIYDSLAIDPKPLMLVDDTNEQISIFDFSLHKNPTDLTNIRFKAVDQKLVVKSIDKKKSKLKNKNRKQENSRKNNRKK